MKIEESNKLIAEFMGWKYNSKKTVISYPFDDANEFFGNHHKVGNLHFHRDWNWLLPVVDRIEKINPEYVLDNFKKLDYNIGLYYLEVISFLTLYNHFKN